MDIHSRSADNLESLVVNSLSAIASMLCGISNGQLDSCHHSQWCDPHGALMVAMHWHYDLHTGQLHRVESTMWNFHYCHFFCHISAKL